jgi:RimJ/RimL family protein N-acetyltransferase
VSASSFDSAERGKGLGTEAVSLFVNWLFEQGAEGVQGGTAVTNRPMRRVFEKLGFRVTRRIDVEGVEELLFAVNKAEWEAAASPP